MPTTPSRAGTRLLRADDPAWDAWLEPARHDIHHTAEFHRFAEGSGEGEAYLAIIGDRRRGYAWPYLLRRIEPIGGQATEAADVTSVYGYPGPLAWGCEPGDAFTTEAWAALVDTWREQRVVSAFTRFHPLLENVALVPAESGPGAFDDIEGSIVATGSTVSVDLKLADEATRKRYGQDLRRRIDSNRRAGLATIHDTEWEHLAAFAALYRETMDRNDASAYYYFDEADFERLRAALDDRLQLLVTMVDDAVAAAGLVTEFEGIVQVHLAASSDAWRHRSPTKVLLDDAIRWARDRGNVVLHLGGGRGGREDSLFWFKSRFSPQRHDFHTGRWIIDRSTYDRLTEAASGSKAVPPDTGFFPAYRAPAADPAITIAEGSDRPT